MDSLGFAYDFKVVVTRQAEISKATKIIETWLGTNDMQPKIRNSDKLSSKSNLEAHL